MALVVGGALVFVLTRPATIHARLVARPRDHVGVFDPVAITFDRTVELSDARVAVSPRADLRLERHSKRLVIAPKQSWQPSTTYTVTVDRVTGKDANPLRGWKARFKTQPSVRVAAIMVDGRPVSGQASVSPYARLAVAFSSQMRPDATTITWNGQVLPATAQSWASDGRSVDIVPPAFLPYTAYTLAVSKGRTISGDQLSSPAEVTMTPMAQEPANASSGIGPGWQTQPPSMVVVENSPPARPQSGLQAADMVFEYLSEYQVTRMTAIYFNTAPGSVGPVRSCRPINVYLGFAFDGHTLCTGASSGTLHYLWLPGHFLPGIMWDWEQRGSHFYENPSRYQPHQVYTRGDLAGKLRGEQPVPQPDYQIDPPHPDADLGTPAAPPEVPLHSVSWTYDAAARTYERLDHGQPFVDTESGQVHAKNVVLVHVPFHVTDSVEDDNGGAHSVWYSMLGTGPAEIYSNGRLIHATWHMGQDPNQQYYDNHQPIWFTDEGGHLVRLNTGLTWLHVIGNGQTS